jgi:hypothetical protein
VRIHFMSLPHRWFFLICLLCAALAGMLLTLGIGGGFIFDDYANITANTAVHLKTLDAGALADVLFGQQPGGTTRILPTLSFALDYWRGGGLAPVVFKATNIVIHMLTVLALAYFLQTLLLAAGIARGRARLAAIALSLAWAIHPLQVSAVLYVVQRMQTLSTLFLVLALWAYLKARLAQMEGHPGRTGWMLTVLLWTLAIGCKEDAVQLPAYTLALELTVLRFQAADPNLARRLRLGYLAGALLGTAIFLFAVVPHYWHWDAYYGRDFSTAERLLTQGRVLCMYLGEILLPLPSHMPFYYDWILPSRGLLDPWTTLPAILLVIALLTLAWRLRTRRPLFALGVFLFFAGHFITSNVVNLELAFEHRNHFPLIGAMLAVGDLLALTAQRLRVRPEAGLAICILPLALLGGTTVVRAQVWNSPLSLALRSPEYAPHSARAWNALALYHYQMGGGSTLDNPYLDAAIATCTKGADNAPYSVTCLTNLVVFKTLRGTVTRADWQRLINRLQRVNMGPENRNTAWTLITNVRKGVELDDDGVLDVIDVLAKRRKFKSSEYAAIGYFILWNTHQPDRGYAYLARSVQTAHPQDTLPEEMVDELRKQGKTEWADKLEALARSRREQESSN